jgi:cell division septum initiation protein DivIVA
MADHLQFRGARIETYTPCGAFMVELLRLDEEERQNYRDFVIREIHEKLEQWRDLRAELEQLGDRLRGAPSAKERAELEKEIAEILGDLRYIANALEILTGEPWTT